MTAVGDDLMLTGEVHPAADVFPMLNDYELQELADDIRVNGLVFPIVIDRDGVLIDGRNRLAACNLAGVPPRFELLPDGIDPTSYILSTNISRRHLTKGQQAMAVVRARLFETNSRQEDLASLVKASQSRIAYASTILQHAPDLADLVLSGAIGLDAAYEEAQTRKRAAASDEAKLAQLRADAPDLADQVVEGALTVSEAMAALQQRIADRDGQVKRDVERLNQLLTGWLTLETLDANPHRELVLAALNGNDRRTVERIARMARAK